MRTLTHLENVPRRIKTVKTPQDYTGAGRTELKGEYKIKKCDRKISSGMLSNPAH